MDMTELFLCTNADVNKVVKLTSFSKGILAGSISCILLNARRLLESTILIRTSIERKMKLPNSLIKKNIADKLVLPSHNSFISIDNRIFIEYGIMDSLVIHVSTMLTNSRALGNAFFVGETLI